MIRHRSAPEPVVALPADSELLECMSRILSGAAGSAVRITRREPNPYASTFATELVTLRLAGEDRSLFCKHGLEYRHPSLKHRRGTPYEALVYEAFLGTPTPAPAYVGHCQARHGCTLALEALIHSVRLSETEAGQNSPIVRAASVLGRWHGRLERTDTARVAGLNAYDAAHMGRWAVRASDRPASPLLGEVLTKDVAAEVRSALTSSPPTVIHGELVPENVLVSEFETWFVDWETAGLGAGEIDLAAMTIGDWPASTRARSELAYATSRWPGEPPDSFRATLAAARLYVLDFVARHSRKGHESTRRLHELIRQASDAARELREHRCP